MSHQPLPISHSHKPAIKISHDNGFFALNPVTGKYVELRKELVDLKKKITKTHVKVYEVVADTLVQSKKCDQIIADIAHPGDVVIFWANGDHKIVRPSDQGGILEDKK